MQLPEAGDGTNDRLVLALVETAPADVQPMTTNTGAPRPSTRDTARRRAETALTLLTATCINLSAKHTDAEDPFDDHAASVCKLAHGQHLRSSATRTRWPGSQSSALGPSHLPKDEVQGQGQGNRTLGRKVLAEKPEAAKFFVPSKHESSLLGEVGKQ